MEKNSSVFQVFITEDLTLVSPWCQWFSHVGVTHSVSVQSKCLSSTKTGCDDDVRPTPTKWRLRSSLLFMPDLFFFFMIKMLPSCLASAVERPLLVLCQTLTGLVHLLCVFPTGVSVFSCWKKKKNQKNSCCFFMFVLVSCHFQSSALICFDVDTAGVGREKTQTPNVINLYDFVPAVQCVQRFVL